MEVLVQYEKHYREELELFQKATDAIKELQEKESMTSKLMLEFIEEMLNR